MTDFAASLQQSLAALQMTYGVDMPEANVAMADFALVSEATDRAALSGPFDPYRLTSFVPLDQRAAVRQSLVVMSEPAPSATRRLRWLNSDRRHATLKLLMQNPAGLSALLSRTRLDKSDVKGRALRDLLRGKRPDLKRVSDARLAAIITALGWMDGLVLPPGMPALPDPRQARIEQSKRQSEISRRALLSDGFVGRRGVLAAIRKFLDDPDKSGEILIISGPGGIGKSALLARAAQLAERRRQPAAVFSFDFDKPSLDPLGPGLTLELARQLALILPDAAHELSRIREMLRHTYVQSGGEARSSGTNVQAQLRSSSEASYLLRNVVTSAGLDRKPVLMLFDTLEVIAAQGPSGIPALREWISFATHQIGFSGLHAITAGRAAENAAKELGVKEPYVMPNLSHRESEQLLALIGLDAARAAEAATILGGNPLVLRLGGRYLIDHPDAPASDMANGGEAGAALTQGVLYRRILNHVGKGEKDPLRKVAYSGLALRLITPGLIENVVAPAVGLMIADPEMAQRLWKRLVDQTWLVEHEAGKLARHRPDLRKDMLRLMHNDSAIASAVTKLHGLAIEYYRSGKDPDIPSDRALHEAIYHQLVLLAPGEEMPEPFRAQVHSALAGEFSDLPPAPAALARLYSGVMPEPGDIDLVPVVYRDPVMAALGWSAVDADRPDTALALDPGGTTPMVWRMTAWQNAGIWDKPEVADGLQSAEVPLSPSWSGQFSSLISREEAGQKRSIADWLHYWRNDNDWPGGPSNLSLGEMLLLRKDQNLARLRRGAVWALAQLPKGSPDRETWEEMQISLATIDGRSEFLNDPTLQDEIARLKQLVWAAGWLAPDMSITIRPAMIVATPAMLKRYAKLCAHSPAALARLQALIATYPEPATTARLTGKYARDISDCLNVAVGGGDRGAFLMAGIGPPDLLPGLMQELRPAARTALQAIIVKTTVRDGLANRLPAALTRPNDDFVPADLHPGPWRSAAGQADGSRAIAALVDWAGRSGTLDRLLDTAAEIVTDETATRLRLIAGAVRKAQAAVSDGMIHPPKIAQ